MNPDSLQIGQCVRLSVFARSAFRVAAVDLVETLSTYWTKRKIVRTDEFLLRLIVTRVVLPSVSAMAMVLQLERLLGMALHSVVRLR